MGNSTIELLLEEDVGGGNWDEGREDGGGYDQLPTFRDRHCDEIAEKMRRKSKKPRTVTAEVRSKLEVIKLRLWGVLSPSSVVTSTPGLDVLAVHWDRWTAMINLSVWLAVAGSVCQWRVATSEGWRANSGGDWVWAPRLGPGWVWFRSQPEDAGDGGPPQFELAGFDPQRPQVWFR